MQLTLTYVNVDKKPKTQDLTIKTITTTAAEVRQQPQ